MSNYMWDKRKIKKGLKKAAVFAVFLLPVLLVSSLLLQQHVASSVLRMVILVAIGVLGVMLLELFSRLIVTVRQERRNKKLQAVVNKQRQKNNKEK